jgi:hypothetical protein
VAGIELGSRTGTARPAVRGGRSARRAGALLLVVGRAVLARVGRLLLVGEAHHVPRGHRVVGRQGSVAVALRHVASVGRAGVVRSPA